MRPLSFKRHRFPADVIRQAVWLYFRFTLSFRNSRLPATDLLEERGYPARNHETRDTYDFTRSLMRRPPVAVLEF